MIESRTKNAKRNIIFGMVNKIVTLFLPFLTRTAILYLLGATYLGVGTLFSSILSFLSLAELGLGSALVYAMYKPIADDDTETLSALLFYYKKFYRKIGIIILLIGILLVPLVPYLMKGEAPKGLNIFVLYYLFLINSVISYFFQGYRQSLLSAYQRTDIINNIASVISIFVQCGQILLLYLFRNFYIYALVPICGTLITNAINAAITKRKYPKIKCSGNVSQEIKGEIRTKIFGLFGTKLNSIVVHSADVMIISAFIGLTATAKYGNYYYIMNAVSGFLAVIYGSLTAGIGNKIVTDSLDENYKLFKKLSFVNAWLVGWCSICFLCLYEPFMYLWAGSDMLLGQEFVILMVLYFFIYEIQKTVLTFKDAAGLWHKDRYRPYVAMTINLVSNILLVQVIGIYGIIISTILSFTVSMPWANYVLLKNLFHKSAISNIKMMVKNFFTTVVIAIPTWLLCQQIANTIGGLILKGMICFTLPNILFILFYLKNENFKEIKNMVLKR